MGDERQLTRPNSWVLLIGYAALPLLNGFLLRHHLVGDAARPLWIGLAGALVAAISFLPGLRQAKPNGLRLVLTIIAVGVLAYTASLFDGWLRP